MIWFILIFKNFTCVSKNLALAGSYLMATVRVLNTVFSMPKIADLSTEKDHTSMISSFIFCM